MLTELAVDPRQRVFSGQTVPVHEALQLDLLIAGHYEQAGVASVASRLHHQGCGDHCQFMTDCRQGCNPAQGFGDDRRVGQRLEVAPGSLIGKDDRAQGGPVQAAIGLQQLAAEAGGDGFEGRLAWGDDIPGDLVGVDDRDASLAQQRLDRRLAAGDVAGQPPGEQCRLRVGQRGVISRL